MAAIQLPHFILFSLFYSILVYSTPEEEQKFFKDCPPFDCGKLRQIRFPFTNSSRHPICGHFVVDGCDKPQQTIQLERGTEKWYPVESISQNFPSSTMSIINQEFEGSLDFRSCESFKNLSLPSLTDATVQIIDNLTLFKCSHTINFKPRLDSNYTSCRDFNIYYNPNNSNLPSVPTNCSILQLPRNANNDDRIFKQLTGRLTLEIKLDVCQWCRTKGENCHLARGGEFQCVPANQVYSAEEDRIILNNCPPSFTCGKLGQLRFPFTSTTLPPTCAPFVVDGCDKERQTIQLLNGTKKWYEVESIRPNLVIIDREFDENLQSSSCESFNNLSLPTLPYATFQIISNFTLFKCSQTANVIPPLDSNFKDCDDFKIYYNLNNSNLPSLPTNCSVVQLPWRDNDAIFQQLTARFSLEVIWNVCSWCNRTGRKCQQNSIGESECVPANQDHRKAFKLGLGLGIPTAIIIILLPITFIIWRRYRRKNSSSSLLSANASFDPDSKSDLEWSNVFFGIPVLSYPELEKATNNFDSKNELGDGGFGTVYYGKLHDGREVAVKRLYEHNYRRVEQFVNEIEILTRLRHKNLVSLYGCTSRHSRELLLVYEYIPNGTVAEHLHGDPAKSTPLAWFIRMRIAIETASALAYLHASDIIHRDVKSNNILLDNNFCVKVADFGLSRLFPDDVTHISTAPQGTPGYIDPEYHQCYQLTDKSDVYSFGVVLIELISSMPAVDITRHRHEINLATLAINKIQKGALDELIDQRLGYKEDGEVERMTTSVAELAFQCLQQDKEMRPSMADVLEELKRIECGNLGDENSYNNESRSIESLPLAPDSNNVVLVKTNGLPPSSDSATDKWDSHSSTTSNISG